MFARLPRIRLRFRTRFCSGCDSISSRRKSSSSPVWSGSGNSITPCTTVCTFPSSRRCSATPDMSISRLVAARRRAQRDEAAPYVLPPTASCGALLDKGSDRRVRALVNDLFTIASRMEVIRTHLGRRMGISGPQYSVLIAVAHLQGEGGVSVGTVAQAVHVSSAFIASETGKMARMGLLRKRSNPQDRRGVLLTLTAAGRLEIDRLSAEIRAINDMFFGSLDRKSFAALCAAAQVLVKGSGKAVEYVSAVAGEPLSALNAAE
ncbi:MAG: winged helix-turn-helix transcriptional regulator [Alphaproteobacteria bacterium]|nr:MAG: winged helix-turn-helix transcriptional regulator [Alphaproteobacteria bacterium]